MWREKADRDTLVDGGFITKYFVYIRHIPGGHNGITSLRCDTNSSIFTMCITVIWYYLNPCNILPFFIIRINFIFYFDIHITNKTASFVGHLHKIQHQLLFGYNEIFEPIWHHIPGASPFPAHTMFIFTLIMYWF